MASTALRACGIRKAFPTGFTLEVEDLALEAGGLYCFVGPNGAGKTVLFEALSLLTPPDTGGIDLLGEAVFPDGRRRRWARRQMALVMQEPYLFRGTVRSNLVYGLRARGVPRREDARRLAPVLERLGLAALAETDVRHLSGGEVRRVAIGQALVLQPRVLFLDEPTAHVDGSNAAALEQLLRELHAERRMTTALSTHDPDQAQRLADRIFTLIEGRLTCDGMNPCR